MSKAAGEIARQAAAVIRKKGWCQHRFNNLQGQVCMRGAFTQVTAAYASEAEQEFTQWMNDVVGLPPLRILRMPLGSLSILKYDLATWNDEPERTKEEVLAYLDKFAEEQDPRPAVGGAR